MFEVVEEEVLIVDVLDKVFQPTGMTINGDDLVLDFYREMMLRDSNLHFDA